MQERYKILFVLPSLKFGGAEMQVIDLINGFDRDLFKIHLVTFDEKMPLLGKIEIVACVHHNLVRGAKVDLMLARRIAAIIDDYKIDAIHCTLQIALFYGALARGLSKHKPSIINAIHRTAGRTAKEDLMERLVHQWWMRRCRNIIFVCKAQQQFWEERFSFISAKAVTIYNGVDPDRFDPAAFVSKGCELRQRLEIPAEGAVVSCVAGFRIEKNHQGLIDVFEEVLKSRPDSYLLLAGDGLERPRIEALVKDKSLSKHVRFLGNLADVRPLLAASDLTVITSISEALSIAMLESMSMSTPMLSSDVGGHREAITPGLTGELAGIGDHRGFVAALSRLLTDRQALQKMGRRAREEVLNRFTVRKMVRETERVLIDAVERG